MGIDGWREGGMALWWVWVQGKFWAPCVDLCNCSRGVTYVLPLSISHWKLRIFSLFLVFCNYVRMCWGSDHLSLCTLAGAGFPRMLDFLNSLGLWLFFHIFHLVVFFALYPRRLLLYCDSNLGYCILILISMSWVWLFLHTLFLIYKCKIWNFKVFSVL